MKGFLPTWTEIIWWFKCVSCKACTTAVAFEWTYTTCLMNLIFDVTVVSAIKHLLTYHDTAKKHELIHTREKSNAWSEFVCEKKKSDN